jgi:hypothetical protein
MNHEGTKGTKASKAEIWALPWSPAFLRVLHVFVVVLFFVNPKSRNK